MNETRPYRPSNGIEAEFFMERWCFRCGRDVDGYCPIIVASMTYHVDEPDYPPEWVQWVQGGAGARCTAFEGQTP